MILLLAFLSEMPWASRPVRIDTLYAAVVLLGTLIAAAGATSETWRAAVRLGPTPWIVALLAWCALSAGMAPFPAFALAEMLRLALGAGFYFTAAYSSQPRRNAPAALPAARAWGRPSGCMA